MTNRAEFERLLDVYGFRCERFGQDLSTHARAQVVAAFAALASAPVAGEAQSVAMVEVSVPHLRSISVKIIPDAPMPNVGDLLYAAPQVSETVRDVRTDQDAARWRTLMKVLRTRVPGPGHGSRLKVVTTDPMYGDEKDVPNLQSFIDDCIQKFKEQS